MLKNTHVYFQLFKINKRNKKAPLVKEKGFK